MHSNIIAFPDKEAIEIIGYIFLEVGGKINLENLKKTLEDHHNNEEKETDGMPQSLQRAKSFKSMSNILSAYEEVN
jgi:hypothetical protein